MTYTVSDNLCWGGFKFDMLRQGSVIHLGTQLARQTPEVNDDFQPLFYIHQAGVFLNSAVSATDT